MHCPLHTSLMGNCLTFKVLILKLFTMHQYNFVYQQSLTKQDILSGNDPIVSSIERNTKKQQIAGEN